ncbi:hypothetical protein FPQ18DRAFT_409751 [Pyronema domesticum]|nr:hypothetical protein FPQ18DRAFT_409751 [Pyronema domesticum]
MIAPATRGISWAKAVCATDLQSIPESVDDFEILEKDSAPTIVEDFAPVDISMIAADEASDEVKSNPPPLVSPYEQLRATKQDVYKDNLTIYIEDASLENEKIKITVSLEHEMSLHEPQSRDIATPADDFVSSVDGTYRISGPLEPEGMSVEPADGSENLKEPDPGSNLSASIILAEDVAEDDNPLTREEHMVLYADLLSDSTPDDPKVLTNGRSDITANIDLSSSAPYFSLLRMMGSFINRAVQQVTTLEARHAILLSYAEIIGNQGRSNHDNGFGSPSTRYQRDAQGNVYIEDSNSSSGWTKVIDLGERIIKIDAERNAAYENANNKKFADEYDSMLATKMQYWSHVDIQNIEGIKEWLASRAYTLELEAMRVRIEIRDKSEGMKDIFGFVGTERKKIMAGLNQEVKMFE